MTFTLHILFLFFQDDSWINVYVDLDHSHTCNVDLDLQSVPVDGSNMMAWDGSKKSPSLV